MTAPTIIITGKFATLSQYKKIEVDITHADYTRITALPTNGSTPVRTYTDRTGVARYTLSLSLSPYDALPAQLRALVNRFLNKQVVATFTAEPYSFTTAEGTQRSGWSARMHSLRMAPVELVAPQASQA